MKSNYVSITDFQVRNPLDWKSIIDQIFPTGRPARAEWTAQEDICSVINLIGTVQDSNYTFFPTTGGLCLTSCQPAAEFGLLELGFERPSHPSIYYAKVSSFIFESFGDPDNYEWDYFWLQLLPLHATGIGYVSHGGLMERLTELVPGRYESLDKWEDRSDDLPDTAKPVTRLLGGSLLTVQKSSRYNADISGACGEHNLFTEPEFKQEMARLREEGGRHERVRRF